MAGARVLHWNGKDIPEELRELPAGTYVVEAIDQAPRCTPGTVGQLIRFG